MGISMWSKGRRHTFERTRLILCVFISWDKAVESNEYIKKIQGLQEDEE